jgi:NAD(P)-dependent dehydrogenase (short-subunit alcohol dehydrogenase family)
MNPSPMFDLSGRVALVTGGGTHLGKAMGRALAAHGAHLIVTGRRIEVVEQAAAEMCGQGWRCEAMQMDVTDPGQVESVTARIAETVGPIDIAVCNAGSSGETRYPPDSDLDAIRSTLESHLLGTVTTANAAARQMLGRGGAIITVSSVHGSLAADPRLYEGTGLVQRSSLAYQSAKAAVIGLTRNLAAELGRSGVRVNCISPGHIPKPDADPEFVTRVVERNALGVMGRPDDLGGAVLLLASDAGRFITGHNLVVDGGWSIW